MKEIKIDYDEQQRRFLQYRNRLEELVRERTEKLNKTNEQLRQEIAERMHIEEALKESRQQLTDVINFLPDATLVIDKEGKVIAWNMAIEDMTGVKAIDMLGKGNYEYALPFYGERRPILIDLVLKPQEEIELKYIYVDRRDTILVGEAHVPVLRGKGAYLYGTASALHNTKGDIIGAILSIHDITERRQVEEALIQAEKKYKSIFDNAVMGIFQTTPAGRVISANPAFARILGYDSPEEVLSTVTDVSRQLYVNSENRRKLLRLIEELGTVQDFEVQFFRKNRSIAWITINIHTVIDNGGKLLYYEGAIQDITDRKNLETQLRQAQKMEAIGTLAGGIAHDFNNILGVIIGYTDMAHAGARPEKQRYYLDQVLRACDRAKNLVNQILTFSRQSEQEKKPVLITPIIREGVKLLRSSLPSTIQITQNILDSSSAVLADPTQIHQILMNLCTNAAQAMRDRDGIITIQLDHDHIDPAETHNRLGLMEGDYARLTVSDTGYGIDTSIVDRIFDPFFTTKEPGEGTGLGLSVVYGIAKNCSGAVDVSSEPGKGTTFSVYLPLIETDEQMYEEAAEPVFGGTERILFVDDEAALVEVGKMMLASLGYHVTSRTSSIEALEVFRARPHDFDLVITDMTMPNMTGVDLAKVLLRIRPDIPIVLCTGFSEMISEEKAKILGIRQFVMKPLFRKDLAGVIREVLISHGNNFLTT